MPPRLVGKQILQQMQSQLINATRQLNMVKAQLQGCETGKRRIDLTTAQLEAETKQPGSSGSESGGEVRLWQGVGKMWVAREGQGEEAGMNAFRTCTLRSFHVLTTLYCPIHCASRFVRKESTDVHAQLRQRKAEVEAEIANLSKKQKVRGYGPIKMQTWEGKGLGIWLIASSSFHPQFLEKQASDAQGHMRDLFSGLEQQQQQQQQATQ